MTSYISSAPQILLTSIFLPDASITSARVAFLNISYSEYASFDWPAKNATEFPIKSPALLYVTTLASAFALFETTLGTFALIGDI